MKKIIAIMCLSVTLYAGYNMVFTEEYVYKNNIVTVGKGETLWEIAERYREEDEDIRDVIDRICDANDITQCIIYPGQDLYVPIRAGKK